MEIERFEVYLIHLDPNQGHEIQKTRPCLIISPDEMNRYISTLIVAPMTTKGRDYPTRIPCIFRGRSCQIVLDQIRTIDKLRLVKKLGKLHPKIQQKVLEGLSDLFAS